MTHLHACAHKTSEKKLFCGAVTRQICDIGRHSWLVNWFKIFPDLRMHNICLGCEKKRDKSSRCVQYYLYMTVTINSGVAIKSCWCWDFIRKYRRCPQQTISGVIITLEAATLPWQRVWFSACALLGKIKRIVRFAASCIKSPVPHGRVLKICGVEKVVSCLGVNTDCTIRIHRPWSNSRRCIAWF